MTQQPLDALVGRIAELESVTRRLDRERRRWRTAGAAALLGLGLLTAAGAASREPVGPVEASEFILRDGEGRARAALAIRPDGTPSMALYDEKSTMRLSLDLGPKGAANSTPGVNVYGEGGELRAALTIRPDGTPGMALFDKGAKPRLSLDLADDDSSGVNIYGPGGTLRAAMALRPDGTPGVGLFDEYGRVVQSIEQGEAAPQARGPVH